MHKVAHNCKMHESAMYDLYVFQSVSLILSKSNINVYSSWIIFLLLCIVALDDRRKLV